MAAVEHVRPVEGRGKARIDIEARPPRPVLVDVRAGTVVDAVLTGGAIMATGVVSDDADVVMADAKRFKVVDHNGGVVIVVD